MRVSHAAVWMDRRGDTHISSNGIIIVLMLSHIQLRQGGIGVTAQGVCVCVWCFSYISKDQETLRTGKAEGLQSEVQRQPAEADAGLQTCRD